MQRFLRRLESNASREAHHPSVVVSALGAIRGRSCSKPPPLPPLPGIRSADVTLFADSLYQWAATMTQSGSNFPFALPLLADKLPTGFQVCAVSALHAATPPPPLAQVHASSALAALEHARTDTRPHG